MDRRRYVGLSWTADGTSAGAASAAGVQLDAGRVQFRFQAGRDAGAPGTVRTGMT